MKLMKTCQIEPTEDTTMNTLMADTAQVDHTAHSKIIGVAATMK